MKTLRNALLTLVLATCATASLTAMEKSGSNSTLQDNAIEELAKILYEKNDNPKYVLNSIQRLCHQYGSMICREILNKSLVRARTSLSKIKNHKGNTVLHIACSDQYTTEIISLILKTESSAGILFIRNEKGELAYDLAKRYDMSDVTDEMLSFANEYGLKDHLLNQAAPEKPKLRTNKEDVKQALLFQPKKEGTTTESFGL